MKYYLAIDIGASSGRHIIGYIENDKIKNKYCKDKGIRLLRIPYFYDENKIKEVINQFITRNDHSLLSN